MDKSVDHDEVVQLLAEVRSLEAREKLEGFGVEVNNQIVTKRHEISNVVAYFKSLEGQHG